jgi:hypothetical protein
LVYFSSALKDFSIRFQDKAYMNVNVSLMLDDFKITAWNILSISRLKTTNLTNTLIHHNFLFQNCLHVPIIVTLRTLTVSLNSEIGI